ncbi:hypothetical protein BFJ68_g14455 [Fusarium oxysporum]|uniref:Uncharacterized protein n=2 Tax=Fusarium oxysporum TaxID=5507 RepID=A0A420PUT6_FUSOX|nr:hypothetical protein BFJ65_g17044 [Fusarium oxysporum f. sp. cepae]RKK21277.1 hypothetical protein BFJ67_g17364 [Fusarium oxysporum f. sp. cepae]RKK23497.1 hypothetical protein BFJ66_g17482 [Fusarium oxysporum f. sp. cepae]RKK96269.1 hypothetical protein BFJ68_g14455 [Fusarium oxysporum]
MDQTTYAAYQQLPKQMHPIQLQPSDERMMQLYYNTMNLWYGQNRQFLMKDMLAQILGGVKTINGEVPQQILQELSSVKERTTQLTSRMDYGGSCIDRLSLEIQQMSDMIKTISSITDNTKNNTSPRECGHPRLDEVVNQFQGLADQLASHLPLGMQKIQSDVMTLERLVAIAVAEESRRGTNVTARIRCVCGSDQVDPKRPNTRRQKSLPVLLIFCENCQALHHGSCVGYTGTASYSCKSSSKAKRKPRG